MSKFFQITPTLIANADDGSLLSLTSLDYSLSDNMSLIASAQLPFGSRGTELGGREIVMGSREFERPPARFFIRFELYF